MSDLEKEQVSKTQFSYSPLGKGLETKLIPLYADLNKNYNWHNSP